MQYQIINHGYENSQYFQGCGVSYTEFEHVQTGCGNDAKELNLLLQFLLYNYYFMKTYSS